MPPARAITALLANEMNSLVQTRGYSITDSAASNGLIVALDDYHHITAPAIHETVSNLITYLPQGMHLALASRTDPPLKLGQLRARREMTELRTADLRFTSEEAHIFLQTSVGKEIGNEATDLMAEKCEGWIVGLRLAALSMRTLSDDDAFVRGFKGTSSARIVDYLASEVLARQSSEVQDFVLRTSILDRFSAPICGVLTETPAAKCREIIARIAEANLFLVPLDEEGGCYRYITCSETSCGLN
jgi:LuxR family maltose regulon positive regulatory protein